MTARPAIGVGEWREAAFLGIKKGKLRSQPTIVSEAQIDND